MLCVRGGHVQDGEWLFRLHGLQRELGTLCDGTDGSHRLYLRRWVYGSRWQSMLSVLRVDVQDYSWLYYLHGVPRELAVSKCKFSEDQLSVRRGVHGARRWDVHRMRGWKIQGDDRERPVLKLSFDLELDQRKYQPGQLSVQRGLHGSIW